MKHQDTTASAPPVIGFLHTAEVHRRTFDELLAELAPGSATVTVVSADLLAAASDSSTASSDIERDVAAAIGRLHVAGADVVLCTCSTLGPIAERVGDGDIDVVRIDRPMMEEAVEHGGRILILAALRSALQPAEQLITDVAAEHGVDVTVTAQLVPAAWERFEADDHERYLAAIADALTAAADTADVVVLAQASMAGATTMVGDLGMPILSSPRPAVHAVVQRARRQSSARKQADEVGAGPANER